MIAIIPAKYTSRRVKNKNITSFYNNKSLLELKIEQLKQIKEIDDIYVSSESDKILEISKRAGAIPIKRLEYYTKDIVPIEEVYKEIIRNIPVSDDCDIIYTPVTSPLIKNKTYIDAIKIYNELKRNVVSFTLIKDFIWDMHGPVNYKISKQPRSQDINPLYKMTSNFFIFNKGQTKDTGVLVTRDCYRYLIDYPECYDIDTAFDFVIAEQLYLEQHKNG